MEVHDPSDTSVYSANIELSNSTASFTYKVPSDVVGGEYTIRVYNY